MTLEPLFSELCLLIFPKGYSFQNLFIMKVYSDYIYPKCWDRQTWGLTVKT